MTLNIKAEVISSIEKMPEDVSYDDIIELIELMKEMKEAEEDIAKGKTHSHENVMEDAEKWLNTNRDH